MFYDLWINGQLFWSVLAWMELDGLAGLMHGSGMAGASLHKVFHLQGG